VNFQVLFYCNNYLTVFITTSLYSKVDPFEKPKRAQSPSAYAMAIEEFKNSGYCDESGNILEDI
jgi:hypothetical protein